MGNTHSLAALRLKLATGAVPHPARVTTTRADAASASGLDPRRRAPADESSRWGGRGAMGMVLPNRQNPATPGGRQPVLDRALSKPDSVREVRAQFRMRPVFVAA